jgi:hypothetical protein
VVNIRELPIYAGIIHLCTLLQSHLISTAPHDGFYRRVRKHGTSTSISLGQEELKWADKNVWVVD